MSPPKLNDLVGDWVAGKSQIENRNPSDLGDREDIFAQANTAQLAAALDHFRQAQLDWAASEIVIQNPARAPDVRRNTPLGCDIINMPIDRGEYDVAFDRRGQSSYDPRRPGQAARVFNTMVKAAYMASGALQ